MKRIRRILLSRVSQASVSIILTAVLTVTSFPNKAFAQPTSSPNATYDVAVSLIGSNQVIISWNASQSTTATGFRIERTATDPSFMTGVVRFTVGSTSNSYTDKTVIGGYTYLYRVIAFNELGDSPSSNIAIVTIPSPVPNPALQIKPSLGADQVSVVSESSVVLGGSLSDLGTAGQCLVYFEWGVDTNYGNIADPKVISTLGVFSVTLRNLRPATTYHYRTVAVGKGAGTVFGVDRTFTTYPAATVSDSLPSIIPRASLRVGQSATNRANAAADNLLTSPDGKIKLTIPKEALAKDADIELTQYAPSRVSGIQVISQFSLKATEVETLASIKQFSKDLQINIVHGDSDLRGIDTRSLHLYYFNDTQNTWVPVQSSYDPKTKTLTATVNHFTTFGEMANPLKSGPGMITAFQNDLQTGAATGAYPIEVPPGPGGFQPKISLQYNSGAVDEMKNKRDVGSWVGIGWSLSLGSISYDEVNNRYSLELNGTSYTLVGSTDNTSYYTLPESFLKITRSGNQWNVWDKGGNYYRFGGTSDSQQYHDSNIYYRWDLSRMQGVASNLTFIDITYIQDTYYGTIRSAYPSVLKYTDGSGNDTVRISFNSSYDYTGADGNMRFDTPNGTAQNPTPPIVENKKLDSIEVRVLVSGTWQLIRKYYFTYAYSNSYYSADYGGIYYSGNYTLSSITQKDSTDSISLPATTFAYEGKQTYLNDNTAVSYNGNPGNPASFNWPHLTIINNGYGANVTYSYTQIPSTSVANMWTREVVSSKSISSGIGPSENRTYTYTGYPQYLVSDGDWWNAKFKGFSQVQDTDAAGNYVIHYFNTVDANDGDALKLTGLETKTEWYSSNGTMLRKVDNQWGWSDSINQGYDLLRQWGATAQLASPESVAVTSNGTVYVADSSNHRVQTFNATGSLIMMWGSYGTGNGQFKGPDGIAVGNDTYVYVADTANNRIQKFATNGTFISTWGSYGSGNGQFNTPLGVAADNNSNVYVVDTYNNRIQKFTANGTYVTQWGSYGSGNGQFNYPYQAAVDSAGNVYIADASNSRIQKFTSNGTFIFSIGSYGSGNGQFIGCTGVTVDKNGNIYGSDNNGNRIEKFDSNGNFLTAWGSGGSGNGQFNHPYGLAADNSSNIYVAEYGNNRVQKFDSSGNFITKWGTVQGSGQLLNSPEGLAVSPAGTVYSVDTYADRIMKFTVNGTFSGTWGNYGPNSGSFIFPYGGAVGPDGSVYVADQGNNRVQKFNSSGSYLTQWGSNGTGNGQFISPRGITVDNSSNVYVVDWGNNRIQKFNSSGGYITQWGTNGSANGSFNGPYGIAAGLDGYIYVADTGNSRVQKFTNTGTFVTAWGSNGTGSGQFNNAQGIAVDNSSNVYVADTFNSRVQKFTSNGTFVTSWGLPGDSGNYLNYPIGISVGNDGYVYVTSGNIIKKFVRDYSVHLDQVTETVGSKVSQTRYAYDTYGNIVTEYHEGDTSNVTDNYTIWRAFYPNTSANILDKVARERVYTGTVTADSGANLKSEIVFYYDGNNTSFNASPIKGLVTRIEQKKDASNSVSRYYTYDSWANKITEQDASGNTTQTSFDTLFHTYPTGKVYAITGMTENYTYDVGTFNMLTLTDVNGQVTTYSYDAFKRLISVDKPLGQNPDTQYEYNGWGNITQQNIKAKTWVDNSTYLWQTQYFDGLGRVVQVQSNGETNYTIVSSTVTYNARGLVDKEYVMQNILSSNLSGYKSPDASWKYVTYSYDGLGRVTQKINADSTWVSYNFITPWQTTVTNEIGNITTYFYDAYSRLVKVQEPGAGSPMTNYSYDILGNLVNVTDATGNATTINYDWLSRKTSMVDPDMGGWTYGYDNNGNLVIQTDNKSQAITFAYDALNRLTGKTYPAGANMTNVGYSYDSGSYGKSQRTGMTDASGNTSYVYDQRGRLITENRTFNGDNISYVTRYGYDGTDRLMWIIYPTGENVSQTYNGRGLPYTVSGNVAGNLVTSTYYNALGLITEMNFNNSLRTTFGYWGTNGTYDNTGGYYGRLWEIKTLPQAGGIALLDIKHTWDAGGNLATRQDVLLSQTETFTYDTLDRLTGVTGPYSLNYTYNAIGNIMSKNGVSYVYGSSKPHALTSDGSSNYTYDNNGNMLTRGSQNITWDAENRPVSIAFTTPNSTNWWNTSWTMRQKLTFNLTSVSSNLSNFPVLVHLTSSNFNFGYAKSNGGDLRFIDADNTTVLNYEIEKWTSSEAWVWVKILSLTGNSSSGYVWMYYDNPGAADGWNSQGVWDANYLMVQHLKETTIDGTTGQIKDSTQNGNNGTSHGMSSSAQVAGKINGSFSFAGNGDYVSVPDSNAWAFGNFTLSVWVNANSWSGSSWTRAFIGQDGGPGETNKWFFSYNGATTFMVNTAGDNNGGTYVNGNSWTPQTGLWYHLSVTKSGSNYSFYRDGATDGSPTNNHAIPNVAAPLTIAWAEGANSFNGIIDEVQISNTARSADWIKASHLSDTDTLITFGSSESVSVSASNVSFVYDGDGNRVKKTENGETILYVNKYYEKNLTTGNVTTYYFSGGRTVAERIGSTLRYLYQDSLSSTSLMTDSSGNSLGIVNYYPFGSVRSGLVPTDVLFKGQRLDDTGLYYSGAGYYDSNIGSFISPHTHAKNPNNPQSLNSYFSNSPAKLFSRAGKIYQPPALAPALAVPVQTSPAQAQAEQALAEPEQAPPPQARVEVPAVEAPVQTSGATPAEAEPAIQSSNSYRYQPMSAMVSGDFFSKLYGLMILEPALTTNMLASVIKFDIQSIDLKQKLLMVNFPNIIGPISFDQPVPVYFGMQWPFEGNADGTITGDDAWLKLGVHLPNTGLVADNPLYFTNTVAHELMHWWDSLHYTAGQKAWFHDYAMSRYVIHSDVWNYWEQRAENYANGNYQWR